MPEPPFIGHSATMHARTRILDTFVRLRQSSKAVLWFLSANQSGNGAEIAFLSLIKVSLLALLTMRPHWHVKICPLLQTSQQISISLPPIYLKACRTATTPWLPLAMQFVRLFVWNHEANIIWWIRISSYLLKRRSRLLWVDAMGVSR